MGRKKPKIIYARQANGFQAKPLFRELLVSHPEWGLNLQNNEGFTILVPPHFFESAYRRVDKIKRVPKFKARYFSQEEIQKLVDFIKIAEERNHGEKYGESTIQLILSVADAATHQRKKMLEKLKRIPLEKQRKIQQKLLQVNLDSQRIKPTNYHEYQNLITTQKLKFSSRVKRYPFVFSLLNRKKSDVVLLNTVYLRGDSYPKHTIIVLRP